MIAILVSLVACFLVAAAFNGINRMQRASHEAEVEEMQLQIHSLHDEVVRLRGQLASESSRAGRLKRIISLAAKHLEPEAEKLS